MINFFKKSVPQQSFGAPLPLTEIPKEQMNPMYIIDAIEQGNAIWSYYNLQKQLSPAAIINQSVGFVGLAVYRKEDHYLAKYGVASIDQNRTLYLKLKEISRFLRSNLLNLYNEELRDAQTIYLDKNSSYASDCKFFIHNLTDHNYIDTYLNEHRVLYTTRDNFYLVKDYPDGLPDRFYDS